MALPVWEHGLGTAGTKTTQDGFSAALVLATLIPQKLLKERVGSAHGCP